MCWQMTFCSNGATRSRISAIHLQPASLCFSAARMIRHSTNVSIAEQLLKRASDPVSVFKEFRSRLEPRSWSGSLASKYGSRLQLLDKLQIGTHPALVGAFN